LKPGLAPSLSKVDSDSDLKAASRSSAVTGNARRPRQHAGPAFRVNLKLSPGPVQATVIVSQARTADSNPAVKVTIAGRGDRRRCGGLQLMNSDTSAAELLRRALVTSTSTTGPAAAAGTGAPGRGHAVMTPDHHDRDLRGPAAAHLPSRAA
jgi:hypothetical protein